MSIGSAWLPMLLCAGAVSAATPVDLSVLPDGIDRVDIFLLLGQSNMKGRGEIPAVQSEDPLVANMNMADHQWYVARHPLHKAGVPDLIDGSDNAGVGPGLDFATSLLEREDGARIALVPCAVGGSWINLWQPGQPFYTNAIWRAQKALADAPPGKGRIKGVLWLQGESDATEARHAAYEGKLATLVQSLRADLGEPELPFIACTIGTFINSNNYPRVAEINAVLLGLPGSTPHTACVDARDVTGHIGDNMHYNTESQSIIGGRYADHYAALTATGGVLFSTDFEDATQAGGIGTPIAMGGTVAGGVSVGTLTAGAGVVAFRLDATVTSPVPTGLFASDTVGTNPSSTLEQAIANQEYMQFTISSAAAIPFGTFAFTMVKSGFAPFGAITLRSSADGYAADLVAVSNATTSGLYPASVDLSSHAAFENRNEVTFRFYLYDAYSGQNNRRLGVDNLVLSSTSAVANPPVRLAALFSSGCVLQRDQPVAIRGDGEPGETLALQVAGQEKTAIVDGNGSWRVLLDAEPAGGPYVLAVSGTHSSATTLTNVYFGDVWLLTGQSNMEQSVGSQSANFPSYYPAMPDSSDDFDDMRFMLVRPVERTGGPADNVVLDLAWTRWQANQLTNMSATGYFFARELKAALNANGLGHVPLGFIKVCKGATAAEQWISAGAIDGMPEPLVPRDGKPASGYYNGMIAPLQDYAVKGVLWYQGEANADTMDRIEQYPLVFKTLVDSWRDQWDNSELPFYFVQLAPFRKGAPIPEEGDWAWMREAQSRCLSVSHTAMACIIDSGLQGDIHPPFKDRVGERLVRIALDQSYGIATVFRGPTVQHVQINASEVVVAFDNVADGLEARAVDSQPDAEEVAAGYNAVSINADELGGFALCGSDQVFYWATQAEIVGTNQLRISNAADVPNPVAVRYAWQRFPRCNLFNSGGLPAEPFRTDAYGFKTSAGADSTPTAAGLANQTVPAGQSLLEIDLSAAFRDVEDGSDALLFSVTGNSDTNVVAGATVSNQVLRLWFSGMAGTSTISVAAQDSAGNSAQLSFEVTVAGTAGYRLWQGEHFSAGELGDPGLEASVWGDAADPDGDGIPNLLEYALALDPRLPDQDPQILSIALEGGVAKVRFMASKQARSDPSVSVGIQTTTNLHQGGWAVSSVPDALYQDLGDAELREVVLTGGDGDDRLRFARIYATHGGH